MPQTCNSFRGGGDTSELLRNSNSLPAWFKLLYHRPLWLCGVAVARPRRAAGKVLDPLSLTMHHAKGRRLSPFPCFQMIHHHFPRARPPPQAQAATFHQHMTPSMDFEMETNISVSNRCRIVGIEGENHRVRLWLKLPLSPLTPSPLLPKQPRMGPGRALPPPTPAAPLEPPGFRWSIQRRKVVPQGPVLLPALTSLLWYLILPSLLLQPGTAALCALSCLLIAFTDLSKHVQH